MKKRTRVKEKALNQGFNNFAIYSELRAIRLIELIASKSSADRSLALNANDMLGASIVRSSIASTETPKRQASFSTMSVDNMRSPFSIFESGKMYNCDLSASYNIGARYFIRELIKEVPGIMTEVSDIGSGTTRTLSTLWRINSVMSI